MNICVLDYERSFGASSWIEEMLVKAKDAKRIVPYLFIPHAPTTKYRQRHIEGRCSTNSRSHSHDAEGSPGN